MLVSNEVGLGIVPDHPLGRAFRDEAGRLNQAVAAARLGGDVAMIGPDTDIHDLARLLSERQLGVVCVVHDNRMVGIVTEGDLLRNPADNKAASNSETGHFASDRFMLRAKRP